jgi:hypothetical protein
MLSPLKRIAMMIFGRFANKSSKKGTVGRKKSVISMRRFSVSYPEFSHSINGIELKGPGQGLREVPEVVKLVISI